MDSFKSNLIIKRKQKFSKKNYFFSKRRMKYFFFSKFIIDGCHSIKIPKIPKCIYSRYIIKIRLYYKTNEQKKKWKIIFFF